MEATNSRTEIPPYESNYVLKKKGMKELTEGQMVNYDSWWDIYSELYWSCEPDQTVENMNIPANRTDIKMLFHEHDENKDGVLDMEEGRRFLKEAWSAVHGDQSECHQDGEPDALTSAKLKAFNCLEPMKPLSFTWKDYKKAHQMIWIWNNAGRMKHSHRVIMQKKREAENPVTPGESSSEKPVEVVPKEPAVAAKSQRSPVPDKMPEPEIVKGGDSQEMVIDDDSVIPHPPAPEEGRRSSAMPPDEQSEVIASPEEKMFLSFLLSYIMEKNPKTMQLNLQHV